MLSQAERHCRYWFVFVFSEGFRQRLWHKSLVADHGASPDVLDGTRYLNPVIDPGCPRSVGGIGAAKALTDTLGIPFVFQELDCEPFFHG